MVKDKIMKKHIIMALLMLLASAAGFSQSSRPGNAGRTDSMSVAPNGTPPWASPHNYDAKAHAYFPDYYTYYDPKRGGYVFWKNGKYTFTPALPPFLEHVDLGRERIKILNGLSLDMHPELHYPYYMKLYPAVHQYNMVPVPTITNPAR